MIGLGGLLAILAAWRFRAVNRQIEAGRMTVDRGLVRQITIVIAALAASMSESRAAAAPERRPRRWIAAFDGTFNPFRRRLEGV